jgi:hypothetical protein
VELMHVQLSARLMLLSGRCTMLSTWRGVSLRSSIVNMGNPRKNPAFFRTGYIPGAAGRFTATGETSAVLNLRTAVRTGTHNPH